MELTVDNYKFNFPNAIDAFKFDETDNQSPHYHGITKLKAVDLIAEFPNEYLFIEIKDYRNQPDIVSQHLNGEHWLRNYLSQKYKDSFLYRYAVDKVDKDIIYICLIEMESALLSTLRRQLVYEALPIGLQPQWHHQILKSVIVVNENRWNTSHLQDKYGTCHFVG